MVETIGLNNVKVTSKPCWFLEHLSQEMVLLAKCFYLLMLLLVNIFTCKIFQLFELYLIRRFFRSNLRHFTSSSMPKYGLSLIHIFPYMNRLPYISDSVHMREYTDVPLSLYGKIRIRETLCYRMLYIMKRLSFNLQNSPN